MNRLIIVFAVFIITSSCMHSKFYRSDKEKGRREFFKQYSDSLNNFREGSVLPSFIFNPCFDNNPWYWNGMHEPISLRAIVINKVQNKEGLTFLLRNFAKELSIKCSKQLDSSVIYNIKITNIDKSFYDLLSKRLTALK